MPDSLEAGALTLDVTVTAEQQVPMPAELQACFELSELEKYYTEDQLAEHPERKG